VYFVDLVFPPPILLCVTQCKKMHSRDQFVALGINSCDGSEKWVRVKRKEKKGDKKGQ
jgi:hypothetical protein